MRARVQQRRAISGMFVGAMRAPDRVFGEWLEERGICKELLDQVCPKVKVGAGNREEELGQESTCVICLEDFENECIVRTLPCLHVFHSR